MTSAYLLHEDHDVTVFEADHRIGGHTHTVPVDHDGRGYSVDTGFIVYNEWTYPNFIRLMNELGVATQPSNMGFSVRCEQSGYEYSSQYLYAQRRNWLRPRHHRMIGEILRFNRSAKAFVVQGDPALSLGEFLRAAGFSRHFEELYLAPMLAAIWSADPARVLDFPALHFLRFFENHGLLNAFDRPQWRVIQGGSHRYVEKLTAPYRDQIRLNCPVVSVDRLPGGVAVQTQAGKRELFDEVIFATHSDTTLQLLGTPTAQEKAILGAIPYTKNEVVLHTDTRLLPRTRRAWASWNYLVSPEGMGAARVTYNMNMLQGLDCPVTFCVSLNQTERIDPKKVLRRFIYEHPLFTEAGLGAQGRHHEISGVDRIHYCGAYWGYGFHEDGVKSALAVAKHFGKGWDYAQLPVSRRRAASSPHAA